jgi:hypothetical protein
MHALKLTHVNSCTCMRPREQNQGPLRVGNDTHTEGVVERKDVWGSKVRWQLRYGPDVDGARSGALFSVDLRLQSKGSGFVRGVCGHVCPRLVVMVVVVVVVVVVCVYVCVSVCCVV